MQIDLKYLSRQFEKSMENYDKHAVVQQEMADILLSKVIETTNQYENILELGCGTGFLTKKANQQLNFNKYTANDIVNKSKKYINEINPNIKFIKGNALSLNIQEQYDLIISNAMFQWFEDFENAVSILKNNLKSDGILAFSTFSNDNFYEITNLTGIKLNYKTKEEILDILNQTGFEILYNTEYKKILNFNTPLSILEHIKNTGVNGINQEQWGIKKVKEFCSQYEKTYKDSTLTYSPIIIVARNKK